MLDTGGWKAGYWLKDWFLAGSLKRSSTCTKHEERRLARLGESLGELEVWLRKFLRAKTICMGFKLKSLILAQIERWRHALHMQVEREREQS